MSLTFMTYYLKMYSVPELVMSEEAIADFDGLPGPIQERVIALSQRAMPLAACQRCQAA